MMIISSIDFEKEFEVKVRDAKSLNLFKEIVGNYFVKGFNTFVKKSSIEEELQELIKQVNTPTIIYHNLNKKHNKYSYYYALGFTSEDKTEIKKIIRASKLKAFM